MAEAPPASARPLRLQLVPAVMVLIVSLSAALALAPTEQGLSYLSWGLFFGSLLWVAVLLYEGRPRRPVP